MAENVTEFKSVKADCSECGAEIVIVTIFKPGFRDIYPLCPYCGTPMAKDADAGEQMADELASRAAQIRQKIAKEAA